MNSHVILIYPQPSDTPGVIPLGLLYLAESLQRQEYLVSIVDGTNDVILDKINDLFNEHIIVFAVSSMSGTQLKNGVTIAKTLKRTYPSIPIVFGGAHTTALPSQTLEPEYIDYVVWGEGEIAFPLLVKTIEHHQDPSDIPGVGYKTNNQITITKRMDYTPLNERTFDLPYELIDMERYCRKKMRIGFEREYYIFTSRGCPYSCYFCSNSSEIWSNNTMRYHTTEHILNDVDKLVKNYHADGITIGDENFFIDQGRIEEVCEALLRYQQDNNIRLRFRGNGRADFFPRLSTHIWELLKETGFVAFGVGVESGSQRVLDIMGKRITLDQVLRTDELFTKYGFYKTYLFMTCVPGETIDDINKTLGLIVSLAKTSKYCPYPIGRMSKYIPLPGTRLFNICVEQYGFNPPSSVEGWVNFDLMDFTETTNVVRPWLSSETLVYVDMVNKQIEALNNLFIGDGRDDGLIDEQIRKMESFMEC